MRKIAPRGKEGAYISLAVLPYFFGKIAATVMADILTSEYFSESMVEYPDHELSWLWIAGMCLLSPLGMIIFRGAFNQSQKMADDEAAATKLSRRRTKLLIKILSPRGCSIRFEPSICSLFSVESKCQKRS